MGQRMRSTAVEWRQIGGSFPVLPVSSLLPAAGVRWAPSGHCCGALSNLARGPPQGRQVEIYDEQGFSSRFFGSWPAYTPCKHRELPYRLAPRLQRILLQGHTWSWKVC
ncbi:hypothetical protein BS78_02G157800 [Paspalum vaginatum]|nr:hypothetical protein BS78_02G157800 [Paspalum vaginatum]